MKNIKYHTVATIPESNIKIVERGKIDTTNWEMKASYDGTKETSP